MTDRYNATLAETLPPLPSNYRWQYTYNSQREVGNLALQQESPEGWWFMAQDSFHIDRSLLGSKDEEATLYIVAARLFDQQFQKPNPRSVLIGVTRV